MGTRAPAFSPGGAAERWRTPSPARFLQPHFCPSVTPPHPRRPAAKFSAQRLTPPPPLLEPLSKQPTRILVVNKYVAPNRRVAVLQRPLQRAAFVNSIAPQRALCKHTEEGGGTASCPPPSIPVKGLLASASAFALQVRQVRPSTAAKQQTGDATLSKVKSPSFSLRGQHSFAPFRLIFVLAVPHLRMRGGERKGTMKPCRKN